jgi:hypothetical protein
VEDGRDVSRQDEDGRRREREGKRGKKRTDSWQTASDGLVLEGRLASSQGVVLGLDGNAWGSGKVVLGSGGGVAIVIVRIVKTLGRAERQRGDVGRRAGHGCFSKESVLSCPVVNCIYCKKKGKKAVPSLTKACPTTRLIRLTRANRRPSRVVLLFCRSFCLVFFYTALSLQQAHIALLPFLFIFPTFHFILSASQMIDGLLGYVLSSSESGSA